MMSLPKRVSSLVRNLARRASVERDLNEEVRSCLELLVEKKMEHGMNERDARRAASIELGGVEQVKEQVREVRMGRFIEQRLQDLRFACRTLRKAPLFSFTVIAVLALGIGSTALIFTIIDSVLLKGPPFPQAERLFMMFQDLPQESRVTFSPREFTVWSAQTETFEFLAAMTGSSFTVTGRGEPEFVPAQRVTPSWFDVLRVTPAIGRAFLEIEGHDGHDRVVILSHSFWRTKFAARSNVLGEPVVLNGEPFTIVGVMPETFDFPRPETKLWVPAALDAPLYQQYLDAHLLRVIGRVKPGVTAQRLQAEADLLGTRVNAPGDEAVRHFYPISLHEMSAAGLRRPLLVLLCAVGFLLLIACANVANLMLARTNARQGEMAVRNALGASRARLIAQLLTEATVLALIGGLAGIAICAWGLDLLKFFAAETLPQLLHAHVDRGTLVFVILISAACGILFGIAPAFTSSRADFHDALKGATRASSAPGADRTRQLLVFAEVALACVLLVGCALMMRSFVALVHSDPGFRPDNLITAATVLQKQRYADAPGMRRASREILERMRAIPGVSSAAVVTHLPFGGNFWGNGYEVEGRPAPAGVQYSAQIRPVSPRYFSTLAIPLKQGRDFEERDDDGAPGVAIVNELLAQRFWPNESPLGHRIRYGDDWLSIVGVCGNIKHAQLDGEPDAEIYVPFPQVPADVITFAGRSLTYVVRAQNAAAIAPQLRAAIQAHDPDLVAQLHTMQALIDESVAQPRFRTWLIAIVSAFALTLASVGIYGVIAYLVTQRRKEIGIRIALGATRQNILQLVLGRTLRLTLAGVIAGMIAAFFLSRFLRTILFGISPHDVFTFIAVPLGLIAVALLATYVPARKATRVDPTSALRYE